MSLYPIVVAVQMLTIILCVVALYMSLNMGVSQAQKSMTAFLFSALIQNVGYLFELTSVTEEAAMVAIRMQYLGSTFQLLFFMEFILCYYKLHLAKRYELLLEIIDTLILIVMWTTPAHNWFYTRMEFVTEGAHPHYVLEHGIMYFVFVFVCCVVPWIVTVCAVIYQKFHNPHALIGKSYRLFLMSTLIPVGYLIFITFYNSEYDLSPIILGSMLSIVVIFIWSRNSYDMNELTLRTVVEELGDGIVILRSDGQIVLCNSTANAMFPNIANDSLGLQYMDYIRKSGKHEGDVVKFQRNNRDYEVHIRSIQDTQRATLGYCLLFLDITETQNYIEKLKNLKEKADAANYAKSQFLSNMSHEIRTPMNSIIGITEILLREKMKKQDREYLLNIKSSGNALISIINDILDFSKIEAGNMDFSEKNYEPCSMFNDLSLMFLTRIGDKPIELLFDIDVNIPKVLYGDEVRVRQVLINVVNNAIKYTDRGFVKLKVTCEIINEEVILHCEVSDSGIGIKEEDQSKLFEAFKRVGTEENYSKEGTGLGLSITKALVNRMGGEIGVTSEYHKGSTFYFDLHQGIVDAKAPNRLTESFILEKTVGACMESHFLLSSLKELLNQYSLPVVEIQDFCHIEQDMDYVFIDLPTYEMIKNQIPQIKTHYKEIILVINRMKEHVIDSNVTILSKPLFYTSLYKANITESNTDIVKEEYTLKPFEAPGVKILLVDDNEMNLKVAKELLKPLKLVIDEALNGKQAIEALKKQDYFLVLMDNMMPVMDGIEATRIIRSMKNPYYETVPIIALTADAIVGVKEDFLAAGMDDFVSKPIHVEELYRVIRKYIPDEMIHEISEEESGEEALDLFTSFGPEIDVESGMKHCNSKVEYERALVDFYRSMDHRWENIVHAYESGQDKVLTVEIYGLRKLAGAIGANQLVALLEKPGELMNYWSEIERQMEVLRNQLSLFCHKREEHKKPVSKEELSRQLGFLKNQIISFEYDDALKTAEILDGYQIPDFMTTMMEQLQVAVLNGEIEETMKVITNLEEMM